MKKWEYMSLTEEHFVHESELDSLGLKGWELVNFVRYKGGSSDYYYDFIFKREII